MVSFQPSVSAYACRRLPPIQRKVFGIGRARTDDTNSSYQLSYYPVYKCRMITIHSDLIIVDWIARTSPCELFATPLIITATLHYLIFTLTLLLKVNLYLIPPVLGIDMINSICPYALGTIRVSYRLDLHLF